MKVADYDAVDDFVESINVTYQAVRECVANGGPPWKPKPQGVTAGSSSALKAVE